MLGRSASRFLRLACSTRFFCATVPGTSVTVSESQKNSKETVANEPHHRLPATVENEPALDEEVTSWDAVEFSENSRAAEKFIRKFASRKTRDPFSLRNLVNDSECLQNLVDLGVNLSQIERNFKASRFFATLNWERDVVPKIELLLSADVPITEIGEYFTGNPWIFKQDMDHLNIRLEYLKSKNFSEEAIARIVTRARYWLNFDVKIIDHRLGWLQREFALTDDEVRHIVTRAPKLITFGTGYIEVLRFTFREKMGFYPHEIKELMVKDPKLWMTMSDRLERCYDYLTKTMGIPMKRILEWPRSLRSHSWLMQQRHEYLRSLGRAQYNPEKPNYISLKSFLEPNDSTFCRNCSKTKVADLNRFIKTL